MRCMGGAASDTAYARGEVGGEDLAEPISASALHQLLRVLYGENHATARRRDRAPFEGRSRGLGVSGSANAATSVFICVHPLVSFLD